MTIQWLLLVSALATVASCAPDRISREPLPNAIISPQKRPRLGASMTDQRILAELGFDPALMNTHRVQGKDGYSTTYTSDADSVLITRSIVTGVFVIQSGPKARRSWRLGKP